MEQDNAQPTVTREILETFFEQINDIVEEVKSQNADKADAFETMAFNYGLDVTGLKRAHKEYSDFIKNAADYHLADGTTTSLMTTVLGSAK